MSAYTLTKRQLTTLRSALTRAKNSGDPAKVIAACDRAFRVFREHGYPDCWHRWNVARDDAIMAQRRAEAGI